MKQLLMILIGTTCLLSCETEIVGPSKESIFDKSELCFSSESCSEPLTVLTAGWWAIETVTINDDCLQVCNTDLSFTHEEIEEWRIIYSKQSAIVQPIPVPSRGPCYVKFGWLTLERTDLMKSLSVTVEKNETGKKRTATVCISSGDLFNYLEIVQE